MTIKERFATRLNKKKEKYMFIPRPCDLDTDKGFYYLCGKKKSSVQTEYYTATLSTRTVFADVNAK